jgi:hypothetical protein
VDALFAIQDEILEIKERYQDEKPSPLWYTGSAPLGATDSISEPAAGKSV